jgi:hypothetical protein
VDANQNSCTLLLIFLTGHFAGHVRNAVQISKTFSEPYRKFESHLVRHLVEAAYSPPKLLSDLSPIAAAISHSTSGLLLGRARSLFSKRPIYLRSSGLRGFGTVLEIPTFRRAYQCPRKEVLRLLWTGESIRFPIRHFEVRILRPRRASPVVKVLPLNSLAANQMPPK